VSAPDDLAAFYNDGLTSDGVITTSINSDTVCSSESDRIVNSAVPSGRQVAFRAPLLDQIDERSGLPSDGIAPNGTILFFSVVYSPYLNGLHAMLRTLAAGTPIARAVDGSSVASKNQTIKTCRTRQSSAHPAFIRRPTRGRRQEHQGV
jgi:hypothetical protein